MLRHQRNMKRIRKDCMKNMVAETLGKKFGGSAVELKEDSWEGDDDVHQLRPGKQSHSAASCAQRNSFVSYGGLGAGDAKVLSERDELTNLYSAKLSLVSEETDSAMRKLSTHKKSFHVIGAPSYNSDDEDAKRQESAHGDIDAAMSRGRQRARKEINREAKHWQQ